MCVFWTANKPSTGYGIVDFFYKLCEKIDDTSMLAFMEMYYNMTSVVRNRGHTTTPIPIQQATRQGGRTSAQCYLAYINGLINIISGSGLGICLYKCNTSCPTVADDMILMVYSSCALQRMIDICYQYSCKWRFEYNASKCAVIVFTKQRSNQPKQSWSLGSAVITETSTYTHLGLLCDEYMSSSILVDEAIKKLRGTLF